MNLAECNLKKALKDWNTEDVLTWLIKNHGYGVYCPVFKQYKVDGKLLTSELFNDAYLINTLNMNSLGLRFKLLNFVNKFKDNTDVDMDHLIYPRTLLIDPEELFLYIADGHAIKRMPINIHKTSAHAFGLYITNAIHQRDTFNQKEILISSNWFYIHESFISARAPLLKNLYH